MLSRTTLLWINRLVWTLLAGAVILLGSIVSLGRYFIPSVESHQQQIIAKVNQRTGLHFSVGKLSASWQHLAPYLVIDDLRLHDPRDATQTVLRVAHAELQFGLFRSIANRTVAISRMRGNGVHVELEETTLGQWHLVGFGAGPSTMSLDRLVEFLAAIYRAELNDSTIDLHFFGGGDAHLLGQTLRLQRAGDFRRLNLELKFADDTKSTSTDLPLRVVLESQGDPRAENSFSGRGYAEFRGVDLTPVLPAAKAFGFNLEHGRVDGSSWVEWSPSGTIEVRGKAEIPQFDLARVNNNLALEPIKNIKTEFLIRDHAEGKHGSKRQLWLPKLTGTWHNVVLKFPQLSAVVDGAQPQRVNIALSELQLSPLLEAALADSNLSTHLRDVLTTLSPQGTLRNVQLDLPLQPDQIDTLRVRAQLQDIALQAWQGAPGVTNASGYLEAGVHEGRVDLLSENFSMAFPHVYHEPLHFDTVRGQVGWRVEEDRVTVDSGPIATRSDAGVATAQVSLDLPFAHNAMPLMTLQVGLQDSATQYRDRFIPYTLNPSLLQWLQRSIGKGDLPIGGFIYRGSLLSNDHLNNTVQLFLHTRNTELAYQPEWPPLQDIRAGVWVDDEGLFVEVKRARIFNQIALREGEVHLQHEGDVSWLTVDVNAKANNDDVLRLLRETPLRKEIGSAFDHWNWRGSTQSRVELGVAISGSRPQEIKVDSQLEGGTLDMADRNIVLEDLRGNLTYRSDSIGAAEKGLHADALKSKWFGKSITTTVATANDGAITIDTQGDINAVDLKQWLGQTLFDFTSGEIPFKSTLRLANGSTTVQVESDLQGLVIDLPPPYRKSAEQSLPFALTMALDEEPNLTATLSDWADLRLRWERPERGSMQLDAGVVRLGLKGKTSLRSGQFIITGAVDAADLSEWRAAMDAHPSAISNEQATEGNSLAVNIREMQFGNAQVAGQELRNLTVSGRRDNAAWTAQVHAEQVAGTLTIPDDSASPWRAQLNYLRLPAASLQNPNVDDPASENDSSPIARADPRDISAVDLHIDHLWLGDEELGWIEMQLRPIENGVRFDRLQGQLRTVRIEPRGEQATSMTWTREGENDRSEFNGRFAVEDVGKALQRWRYEPVLTSKHGYLEGSLRWPGRPDQFKFVQADGSIELSFDDGQFTRASNSATGALKVVGIFNFANFLRRLQFDFSDIYKGGLSFDEMHGSLVTQQGVLTTEQPVDIKSPSSRFRLAGKIDFNANKTDMELIATLPVASNLPWVAALTGALPVAAGLYVAGKVFEDQFDKFSSATYEISGPWDDPQVKFRRVFDDKLPGRSESATKAAESDAAPTQKAP